MPGYQGLSLRRAAGVDTVSDPASLAPFTLLIGVAWLLWTAVGHAVAQATPRVRLPCKRKGPRLSLLRVDI